MYSRLFKILILCLNMGWPFSGFSLELLTRTFDAARGVVILDEHDIANFQVAKIQGEFAIYWGQRGSDITQGSPSATFIKIPGRLSTTRHANESMGTIKFYIDTQKSYDQVGMRLPRFLFNHRVKLNQKLLTFSKGSEDKIEPGIDTFTPPELIRVDLVEGRNEVQIEFSNQLDLPLVLAEGFLVGSYRELKGIEQRSLFFAWLPQGGMFLIGIYLVMVGLLHKKDGPSLTFGCIAIIMSIYLLAGEDARGLSALGVETFRTFQIIVNIWTFIPAFLLVFIFRVFPKMRRKLLERFSLIIASLAYFSMFTISPAQHLQIIYIYQLFAVFLLFYSVITCLSARRLKMEFANSLLTSMSLVALAGVNDILLANGFIKSINLTGFASMGFYLSLAIVFSSRASKNLVRAERAEAETRDLNATLEHRVLQQTNQLQTMMKNLHNEKEQIEKLNTFITEQVLRRYFPPELVAELSNGLMSFDDHPKKMDISVLFADLCEFTKATEKLGVDRIVQILEEFFNEMTAIAFETGGTIDKFTGDGIMVLFGAPNPDEPKNLNRKAVMCAQRMQKAMNRLNIQWRKSINQEFLLRIGISHGPAIVGSYGNSQRVDYTAIGSAVNLASRLEGIAAPGQILVSESVIQNLAQKAILSRGMRTIKGFHESVEVFEVEDLGEAA